MKTSPEKNFAELNLLLDSAALATKPEPPTAPFGFATATLAAFKEQRNRQSQMNRVLFKILGFAACVSCLCLALPASVDSGETSANLFSTDTWVQQSDVVEQYYDELASN
jgi:hypothetical protein